VGPHLTPWGISNSEVGLFPLCIGVPQPHFSIFETNLASLWADDGLTEFRAPEPFVSEQLECASVIVTRFSLAFCFLNVALVPSGQ